MSHRLTALALAVPLTLTLLPAGVMAQPASAAPVSTETSAEAPAGTAAETPAVQPPAPAQEATPATGSQNAQPGPIDAPASPVPHRVQFSRGNYKPGIESLRIVSQGNTIGNIAMQAGIAIGIALFTRGAGVGLGVSGFSKDDLKGDPVEGLVDTALATNPASADLVAALEENLKPKEAAAEDSRPASDPTSLTVTPGPWHLVYESLTGNDTTFRLKWGAVVTKDGSGGLFHAPVSSTCEYQSQTPAALDAWRANDWQRLRDERTQAVKNCMETLHAQWPRLTAS